MIQPQILAPVPLGARFLTFSLRAPGSDPAAALARLGSDPAIVLGLGAGLGRPIDGLRPFPVMPAFPSTQGAVWAAVCHGDRGAQLDAAVALAAALGDGFVLDEEIDCFLYRGGRDLSGFEDGTENPKGDAAREAAIVSGRGPGLDGGSFVAVQRWVHDHDVLARMSARDKSAALGRDLASNEELEDAASSAHVKRAEQESFDPPGFMVRRSMPWGGVRERGLYFVAYGEKLDRFERTLSRMAGRDDGVSDSLLSFTRAVTGGYYFCPPVEDGRLDLRALGR